MSKKDDKNYRSRSERNKDKHRKSRELNENIQDRKGFAAVLIVLFAILIFLLYLIFSGGDETDQASDIDTSSDQVSIEVRENSDTDETDPSEDPDSEDTSDTAEDTSDTTTEEEDSEEEEDTSDEEEDTSDEEEEDESDSDDSANPIEEQNPDNNLEEVEPSEGAVAAYEGDWDPIGTEQSGPHQTDYSSGSQDRIEIKQAVSNVTGLDYNTMIEHWVGNDGTNNGVYATVSDRQQTQFYRVHLTWNDGAGWQPQSIEVLE